MSLLKYVDDQRFHDTPRGPRNFFHADAFGVPFRGQLPLLRQNELRQLTHEVVDGYCRTFDLGNFEDAQKLNEIVDAYANKWYRIYRFDHQWVQCADGRWTVLVFCMWGEPHRELNRAKAAHLAGTVVPALPSPLQSRQ